MLGNKGRQGGHEAGPTGFQPRRVFEQRGHFLPPARQNNPLTGSGMEMVEPGNVVDFDPENIPPGRGYKALGGGI